MPDVPPDNDLELDNFSANFDTRITATPTIFGLTAGDATAFHGLAVDFHTKMLAATNPGTRTSSAIALKDTSKQALQAKARQLIKMITAFASVTPAQREDLGLRQLDTIRTPIPAPTTKPVPTLTPNGHVSWVDEANLTKRGKPAGCAGALLFCKIDGPPPATPDDCRFVAMVTKTNHDIPIPPGSNGKTLYVLLRWVTESGDAGPVSVLASSVIVA
jgi:hypothetical protein